jgi:hypothetical protein
VSGDPHDQGCGLDVGRDLAREAEDVAVGLDGLEVQNATARAQWHGSELWSPVRDEEAAGSNPVTPTSIPAGQRPAPELVRTSRLPVQQQDTASTATKTRIDLRLEGTPTSMRCASRVAIGIGIGIGTSVRIDLQRHRHVCVTREMGMEQATGSTYESVVFALEVAARP